METKALLEKELEAYFTDKAPFQFPQNFKDIFVKYWPMVTLVLMILALPFILPMLGLGALMSPFYAMGMVVGDFSFITGIISVMALIFNVMALSGLFNRTRSGWVYSYYSQLLHILNSIFAVSFSGIFFGFLFLMLLFQVRNYYK